MARGDIRLGYRLRTRQGQGYAGALPIMMQQTTTRKNTMGIGFTNQRLKDKIDKGQYLSDTEKAYLKMEAKNAVNGVAGKYRGRGSHFVKLMAEVFHEEAQAIADEE